MALVRTQCPQCGTVEVACSEVMVLRHSWDDKADYVFPCPRCSEHVRRPLSQEHVETLLEQGAHLVELEAQESDPLTLAEVVAFSRMLSEPGALENELARLVRG